MNNNIVLSIVSHAQAKLVKNLLSSFSPIPFHIAKILVRENVADETLRTEEALASVSSSLRVYGNSTELGFGENHKLNFQQQTGDIFFILNPDLVLNAFDWQATVETLNRKDVALVYAHQHDIMGNKLDFERELVTPWAIFKRHVLRKKMHKKRIDWIPGAFMGFRAEAFNQLGGFDSRYFMYCEDVDICLRLQMAGYKIQRLSSKILHDTQRNTLKSRQHLLWHLRSLLRLWCSPVFWRYLHWRRSNNGFLDEYGKTMLVETRSRV